MTDKEKMNTPEDVGINNHVSEEGNDSEEQEKPDTDTPVSEERRSAEEQGKPDADASANESEKQLEIAKAEAKESHDRLLRVSAEFENYKKRSARETESFKKFANESLIKALLPVVDNLELALKSAKEDSAADSIVEGVEMILKEMLKIFEKFGVTPIESLEKAFDPNFHEAVVTEESEDHPENTVIKEFQKGYMMHDRLLRPAMVVVSKNQ